MTLFTKYPTSPVFLAGVAAAAVGIFLVVASPEGSLVENGQSAQAVFFSEPFDFQGERSVWAEQIDNRGAESAYEEFKERYREKDLKTQHVAAHVFGGLLYEKEGLPGVAICDSAFAFGCYHLFLTMALADRGLEAVSEINAICLERFGEGGAACQHGIGHGLLEYLGYDMQDVEKALRLCPPPVVQNPFVGCPSGVFMEYYSRVAYGEDSAGLEWREFDPLHPYEPCPSVQEAFQGPCYAQLGLWWDTVLEQDYGEIGNLCRGITEERNQRVCFFAAGMFAATLTEYDVDQTLGRCEEMPDVHSKILCRSGAHRSFLGYSETQSMASRVCESLEGERKERCTSTTFVQVYEG